jgi:hypothetical protein
MPTVQLWTSILHANPNSLCRWAHDYILQMLQPWLCLQLERRLIQQHSEATSLFLCATLSLCMVCLFKAPEIIFLHRGMEISLAHCNLDGIYDQFSFTHMMMLWQVLPSIYLAGYECAKHLQIWSLMKWCPMSITVSGDIKFPWERIVIISQA